MRWSDGSRPFQLHWDGGQVVEEVLGNGVPTAAGALGGVKEEFGPHVWEGGREGGGQGERT